jgi:LacI family transcriptional regulator
MATIRDVAKMAGVSVATVSRIINQKGYVSKEAEEKVLECMAKLNYTPNSVARGLAGKETHTIALITPDITNPFFSAIASAVENTATALGYTTFLGNSYGNGVKELRYIDILKKRYVDGIILATQHIGTDQIYELLGSGIPIVSLDRAAGSEGVPSIQVDHYVGAKMAVEHLLSIGCTRIAHISGPKHIVVSLERQRGCTDALYKANCFHPDYIVEGDFSIESGMRVTEKLLHDHPEIDGIVASNDLMAVGALKALVRSGRRIPHDVALIGFDGIDIMGLVEPEISTVAQPIYEIGKQAVHMLVNQMENKEQESMQLQNLELKLIQRATTLRK